MFKYLSLIVLLCNILLPKLSFGQQFFRIKADVSIKVKNSDGASHLTIGSVYYDQTVKKIIYKITFPEKETWVVYDTLFYKIVDEKIIERKAIPSLTEFSIFSLALSGRLADFGLKNSNVYNMSKVEKEDSLVITTWEPLRAMAKILGKVVVSDKMKKLFGVVQFDPTGEIVSKQLFKNYKNINGLEFPTEIIQITNPGAKENYQVITYKNIEINELTDDAVYNYYLPE